MTALLPEGRLDSQGMFEAAAALADQVAAAAEAGAGVEPLPDADGIENIVVLGMGGSGIAGDVLSRVVGRFLALPVVPHKGYSLPSFVSGSTLVFAVSFSGNTEETNEAAEAAVAAGAQVIVVSGGGQLTDLAEGAGLPLVSVPDGIPQPRAGLAALAVPPMIVLERMGLFSGARRWVDDARTQLERRAKAIADGRTTTPADLARQIGRTVPVIYGGGGIGGVAAARWKTQINENAKAPAFANTIPELTHNEIAGWGQHGDMTRQVFTLISLRHDEEHPQVSRRLELTDEVMDEVVASHHQVRAEGDGPLAQFLDLVMVGDFMSLEMAALASVDPGPVPILDYIKASLR